MKFMMKLSISKDANVNYLAKIVKVDSFKPHPNANKLKLATVDGYIIAISSDYKEGIYIYFPTECTIDPEFLSFNNLYRKSEKNADKNKQGFFEDAKLFNIIVYRITSTDIQGRVHEWSVRQMIDYCDKYGINHIKELYYGKAKDLFDLSTEQH